MLAVGFQRGAQRSSSASAGFAVAFRGFLLQLGQRFTDHLHCFDDRLGRRFRLGLARGALGSRCSLGSGHAATRHAHFVMDGSGPVYLTPPSLDLWPNVDWTPDYNKSKKVNLDTRTKEEVASWKPGDTLLLNGKMLTGRDAAHKRIQDMLAKGEKLPVDFTNRVIYYVGPADPVRDEAVGPAGPTTATRMDKFTDMMLEQTGLIAMIGKAERGPVAIESIKNHKSAYLMAVGGAAYLVSKAIKTAKVVGFEDLGMEAIYEFDVVDMPVTVAVDAGGTSAHITGPAEWQKKIATGEFKNIAVTAA